MNIWMIPIVGFGSAALCWLVLRGLLAMQHSILPVDVPNPRSLHGDPTPRGGGIVMIGVAVLGLLALLFHIADQFHTALLISILVIGTLGWLDDHGRVSARAKLFVEFAAGAIVLLVIKVPVTSMFLLMFPLLLLWIVWMVNVYNFMDGIDGLVASQTTLASVVLAVWFYIYGDLAATVFCVCLAGSAVGFLLLNWFPAKVFLGDTGSLSLGLIFALLAIYGIQQHDIPVRAFLLLHGVFLLDTTITLLRRMLSRQRWWEAHDTHLYQRFVKRGMTHSEVSILYMLFSVCLVIFATYQMVLL